VQLLLEHGANVNSQNNYDHGTPLHRAWESKNLEIVRLLLDHGADVHIRSEDGSLFQLATRATREGHHDIAQLLLDRGAKREEAEAEAEAEEDRFDNIE